MMVERLFLAVPQVCLQFVIVVFPDHTHLLFLVFPAQEKFGNANPGYILLPKHLSDQS